MFSKFSRLFSGRGFFGKSKYQEGKWGATIQKGIRLDGVDDYIDLGNILNAQTTSLTFAIWLFHHNTANFTGTYTYVSKGVGSVGSAGYSLRSHNGSPFLHFRVSDATTVAVTSVAFPAGNVGRRGANSCIVFTLSSASNIINAQISTTSFGSVSIVALGDISASANLLIGADSIGGTAPIVVYGAQAWRSYFTPAQMKSVFLGNNTISPDYSWDFNNVIGSTLVDSVGGANGTIVGGVEFIFNNTRPF